MSLKRSIINSQIWLSEKFDAVFFPKSFSKVGWGAFYREVVPAHITKDQKIYDIGSGKRPAIQWEKEKIQNHNLHIVGADIDESELKKAPKGLYKETLIADICNYKGPEDGDLAICGCLLEHVKDMNKALQGAQSVLKPGGKLLIFVPHKYALFAQLNMLLPQKLKTTLLNFIHPKEEAQYIGFPAYYDHSTPKGIVNILESLDMHIDDMQCHFFSNYFMFFTPFHIIWRLLYQLPMILLLGKNRACENFIIVAEKKGAQEAENTSLGLAS